MTKPVWYLSPLLSRLNYTPIINTPAGRDELSYNKHPHTSLYGTQSTLLQTADMDNLDFNSKLFLQIV